MDRKKVGIITFHRADNLGAVLQAFALQTVIDSECFATAEIIDYECAKIESTKQTKKSNSLRTVLKCVLMKIYYGIKHRGFERFRRKYLNLTTVYNRETIGKCSDAYDCIITGSDQVWNLECSKNDYVYFLNFVASHKKKISYAASIGTYHYTENDCDKIIPLLNRFESISVREKSAAEELKRIGICDVEVHSDPVVLLSSEQWKKYMTRCLCRKKYVLVYLVLPDRNVTKAAEAYASQQGLKVISNKKSIEFILHNSPAEFLSWIYYADCVFTNSFHGTAFSTIFNKPLVADIKLVHGGINNRVSDFLHSVSAEGCIMDDGDILPVMPNAQDKLVEMKQYGLDYLKKI